MMDHEHGHHQNHNQVIAAAMADESQSPTALLASTVATTLSQLQTITNGNGNDGNAAHIHVDVNEHAGHQMRMFFHGGCEEVILFSFWEIESFFGLLNSMVFIFLLGTLYEAIKWFRVYFQLWTADLPKSTAACVSMNSVSKAGKNHQGQGVEDALIDAAMANSSSCPSGCEEASAGNTLINNQEVYAPTVVVHTSPGASMPINRWTWLMMYVSREFSPANCRLIETAIYATQLLLAYWLMLIAMTFNVWLTAAVVLGAGFGHWLFANIKCAPPRRCYCSACCNGNGGPEHAENFASDACH